MLRDLSEVPTAILRLPKDARGDFVPWHAKWYGSRPELMVPGEGKFNRAVAGGRCWICGERLWRAVLCFVLVPREVIERVAAEPPSHADCAAFAVRGGFKPVEPAAVKAIYKARTFKVFTLGNGSPERRIRLAEPVDVAWWKGGRPATRAEVASELRAWYVHLPRNGAIEDGFKRALRLLPSDDPSPAAANQDSGTGG
jgi:hypothetical protein